MLLEMASLSAESFCGVFSFDLEAFSVFAPPIVAHIPMGSRFIPTTLLAVSQKTEGRSSTTWAAAEQKRILAPTSFIIPVSGMNPPVKPMKATSLIGTGLTPVAETVSGVATTGAQVTTHTARESIKKDEGR